MYKTQKETKNKRKKIFETLVDMGRVSLLKQIMLSTPRFFSYVGGTLYDALNIRQMASQLVGCNALNGQRPDDNEQVRVVS
jgi:hypothetical protein